MKSKALALSLLICSQAVDAAPQSSSKDYARELAAELENQYTTILVADVYDPLALCAQSGLIAQAYLQAGRAGSYNYWKRRETAHCAEAKRKIRK